MTYRELFAFVGPARMDEKVEIHISAKNSPAFVLPTESDIIFRAPPPPSNWDKGFGSSLIAGKSPFLHGGEWFLETRGGFYRYKTDMYSWQLP